MERRGRGEGAIYRRADGRWEAQIRLPAGRRKSVYARTRPELLHRLRDARWSVERGLPLASSRVTVGE